MYDLKWLIDWLARGVELVAAIIIGLACAEAAVRALVAFVRRGAPQSTTAIRIELGRWLALGLEFELAADILRTAVTPTWRDIAQLAAIAALRTGLNYFLAKEVEKESATTGVAAESTPRSTPDSKV